MKYVITLVSVVLLFASCKKSTSPATNNTTSYSLTASLNGVAYSTTLTSAEPETDYLTKEPDLSITGATAASGGGVSHSIHLQLYNYTGVGTYVLDDLSTVAVNSNYHECSSGQVIVTSKTSTSLAGTFSFQTDSINVTAGTFNVPIIP